MIEDYTKYLSIDNGFGILIRPDDAYVLDKFHIDYKGCHSLKELMLLIEDCLDEDLDDELEDVLYNLSETYYYQNVKK